VIVVVPTLSDYTHLRFRATDQSALTFLSCVLPIYVLQTYFDDALSLGLVQTIENLQKKCIVKFSEMAMHIISIDIIQCSTSSRFWAKNTTPGSTTGFPFEMSNSSNIPSSSCMTIEAICCVAQQMALIVVQLDDGI
jgi:hypothetical protein